MATGNRIDATFERLKADGESAFIAYYCAGDPSIDATLDIFLGLDDAGVDIVEIGVPFSDPLADGIVNQMAAQRALEAGATLPKVLEVIGRIREHSQTPIVIFTYLNPVYTYGFGRFHIDAAAAGADGILLLDLPPDEAVANDELANPSGLKQIRLISPTTPVDRIATIAAEAEGFVYYVSREGVTGVQQDLAASIGEQVDHIRAHATAPVAVGFGINTPEQSATVAKLSDGVVVGSAIVRKIAECDDPRRLRSATRDFVKPLVDAVKSV